MIQNPFKNGQNWICLIKIKQQTIKCNHSSKSKTIANRNKNKSRKTVPSALWSWLSQLSIHVGTDFVFNALSIFTKMSIHRNAHCAERVSQINYLVTKITPNNCKKPKNNWSTYRNPKWWSSASIGKLTWMICGLSIETSEEIICRRTIKLFK